MKTITVSEEFYQSALKLSEYVDGDDSEFNTLKELIREGVDPKRSVLHAAAIVGGWEDQFQETIDNYKKELDNQ